tara:strand:- start:585 stop:2777 length:2193 start_codon:yes stop_codon:yes gene_type:complete
MSVMSKITFYPKIALRYFYELIIKFIKFFINFLANIGLIIIGILVSISLLSYNKFDSSLNTSSDDLVNNLVSSPGSYTSDLLVQMFGLSSIIIPISLIIIGFFSLTNRSQKTIKVISLLFLCLVTLSFASHMVSQSGGVFGFLINNQFMFLVNFLEIEIDSYLKNILIAIFATISLILGNNALLPNKRFKVKEIKKEVDTAEEKPQQVRIISKETKIKPIKKDKIKPKEKKLVKIKSNQIGYELPSLELLKEANENNQTDIPDNLIEENRNKLSNALKEFGVEGDIDIVRPGPVVTLYELKPAPGIKTKRVISLTDDIAREMAVASVRIAVVPGKNSIGIELPNKNRNTVYLREIFDSENFQTQEKGIPLSLGKDIGGTPIIADLSLMPHLLISGTTGSGKSVGINGMILSILYKFKPEDCRLIMVDPKMLELSVYDGIPHLLTPVVTNPKKAVVALKWVVREMEERYKKMAILSVRNMAEYNRKAEEYSLQNKTFKRRVHTGYDENQDPIYEEEEVIAEKLPFIVVVIDEMADLMLVAKNDIEHLVQRLAQMARAAGIHVVMATQRPSVDVVTGTIKANFPTRISFRVASMIDSRTILNEMGAEQLLGNGDMLFLSEGGRVTRVHGAFVSDSEVEKIVSHIRKQENPDYIDEIVEEKEEGNDLTSFENNSEDTLYNQAVTIVTNDKRVSISYIQRKLQIGYNRAARIVEEMEEKGIVSAPNAQGKRELL